MQDYLGRLFIESHFTKVGDRSYIENEKSFPTFEGIHGDIHVFVGGNEGFMSFFDTAPYDPIFWLHHW
jgi:hypothetical protein